ncbi:MAG: transcription termination factor NusA [Gemmatimonadetes bacterium]|nr:transcription termination factor NusA [Gemmatimonadota bacterium]
MSSPQVFAALKVVTDKRNLSEEEGNGILREAIFAGLTRVHGPSVQAEVEIDGIAEEIDIVLLRRVVREVGDPASEVSLEEARWDDPEFEVGDVMEVPVEFTELGLNAVRAISQKLKELVRDNERNRIRDEFSDVVGDLLTGEVQQNERGKLVVTVNRAREADAIIPWKEQNPRERFRQGDPIRAVLKKVDETPRGPRLILSRSDRAFVAALFRIEVPEIHQGVVQIREIAREVGGRTKIAVVSDDESIDPVGACVGLRGSRVQAVVNELGGERIDIVPWHPDTEVFARRALAPARVARVLTDPNQRVVTAIVDEDQLSLAIGRNGQNVRLASQLVGWQIDLYGSREWIERGSDDPIEDPDALAYGDMALKDLPLPSSIIAALEEAGFRSFLQIIDLTSDSLQEIQGVSEEAAKQVLGVIEELTEVEDDQTIAAGSA